MITAISLGVVAINAASGTVAYARKRRVDWKSGILFGTAGIPGALLGVRLNDLIPRMVFERAFAAFMTVIAILLLFKKHDEDKSRPHKKGDFARTLKDKAGRTYRWNYSLPIGLGISAVVGIISSFLGIGGGVVHVPALSHLLFFPVHIATATSHFTLLLTGATGVASHALDGSLAPALGRLLWLAPGVILGAQLGAKLSDRVKGRMILKLLAVALLCVAARLALK